MFHFIFPGQGSQQVGMGRFLFDNFSIAQQIFEEASDSIKVDLKKLCFEGPDTDLNLTENTQPALLTVSTATQKILTSQFGIKANAVSGHSIGEYAALVMAESLQFSDAIKAVKIRGQAMQAAVPVGIGGMTAIMGLDPQQVDHLCKVINEKYPNGNIQPANYNCPGQIVISGTLNSLNFLKDSFKVEEIFPDARRVKLIPLQVSAPFHCQLMKPAEEKMKIVLTEMKFNEAKIPVIQNLTAQIHTDAATLRKNLIEQVSGSVRWMQSMETAKSQSWSQCIESGHGKVLQGLLKKIDSQVFQVWSTQSLDDLKAIEEASKFSA